MILELSKLNSGIFKIGFRHKLHNPIFVSNPLFFTTIYTMALRAIVRDYGNQISIFAFGAKSWGISFSNQIHKRELHEFYILEQWPRAMECYQKFSQPKIFTQNQSSIMRQTTQNIVSRNEKWKIQKKSKVCSTEKPAKELAAPPSTSKIDIKSGVQK